MDATSFTFSDLSKFLKRAPTVKTYVIPTALILVIDYLMKSDVPATVFAFIVPLIVIIAIDRVFVHFAKFHFPARRVYYLDFMSFFFAEIYFILLKLVSPNFLDFEYEVMITFSTTALLRSMVLYTYYSDRYSKIALPSLAYAASVMIGLSFLDANYMQYISFLAMTVIFSLGGYFFADVSVSSFKDEFGQSPIKILNFFLNSRAPGSTEEDAEIFFRKIYDRESTVPVQVAEIRKADGGRKVILVFPYVHPGPFGNIGTSNLPYKLQSRLSDLGTDLMVFHTTTTNSNNSATEADIDRIAEAARNALNGIEFQNRISRFERVQVGGHYLGLLRFGEFGLGAVIPDKEKFDDISLSEGLRMIEEMKQSGASDFIALDAQTYFLQGAQPLTSLDDIIEASKSKFAEMRADQVPRIGYHRVEVDARAMGPLGVQCLVLETSGMTQALVLTDSNNITEELINLARKKAGGIVDEIEFFTTDNHYINAGTLDMNPLGQRDNPEKIADLITESIRGALGNVEECTVGMATGSADVSMGEESTFRRLLDSVRVSLRRARFTIAAIISLCIVSTLFISYFAFYMLGIM